MNKLTKNILMTALSIGWLWLSCWILSLISFGWASFPSWITIGGSWMGLIILNVVKWVKYSEEGMGY